MSRDQSHACSSTGTLDKLREARKLIDESGYDIALEIDGGVTTKNIKEIKAAGADMFVAGSAIFGSELSMI